MQVFFLCWCYSIPYMCMLCVTGKLIVQDRVQWFTTMVGKKATMKRARALLHAQRPVPAVRSTEFVQGRTSRWGLAWSFICGCQPLAPQPQPPQLSMPIVPKWKSASPPCRAHCAMPMKSAPNTFWTQILNLDLTDVNFSASITKCGLFLCGVL